MSKKKIGILTFHRAVNYGAVLQTYATQTALNNNGFEGEVLDYKNRVMINYYYSPFGSASSIKGKIGALLGYGIQYKRNKAFRPFFNNKLKLSRSYTKENIAVSESKYDGFITGSDQVWNLPCTSYDATYFLDFVKNSNKKHSFAVSMGKFEACKEAYAAYFPLIEQFANVSLREDTGKRFVEENTSVKVTLELDPVFLLKAEEWRKLSVKPDMRDYVMIYSVNLTSDVLECGRRLAAEKKKKLVVITLRNKGIRLRENEYLKIASPEEFIGWIDNADYVVSNSFHGTAFSILLNKQFYLVKNDAKKGLDNSRLEMLLSVFGLKDREISSTDKFTDNEINYNKVNVIIDEKQLENMKKLISIAEGS